MCEYILNTSQKCHEDAIPGQQYCILHQPFPLDKSSSEYLKLRELKIKKIERKISAHDYNFEGAHLCEIRLNDIKIIQANFTDVTFTEEISLHNVNFSNRVYFTKSKFKKNANFVNVHFNNDVIFDKANFLGFAGFYSVEFKKGAYFRNVIFADDMIFEDNHFFQEAQFHQSQFNGITYFRKTKFEGNTLFVKTNFGNNADFCQIESLKNLEFYGTRFYGPVVFDESKLNGMISFYKAIFEDKISFKNVIYQKPQPQEEISRLIKQKYEELGDRTNADQYFYREMEAKRLQKPWYIRYPEWFFIQEIFGYGVRPIRVVCFWFLFILGFTGVYYYLNGISNYSSLFDYLWLSVSTATTPGFGNLDTSPQIRVFTIIEAILGTFIWVSIIAIISRKFFR